MADVQRGQAVLMFQSSPTPKGGRYYGSLFPNQSLEVSILAHPERWALPGAVFVRPELLCFNPRPPRKVGATL